MAEKHLSQSGEPKDQPLNQFTAESVAVLHQQHAECIAQIVADQDQDAYVALYRFFTPRLKHWFRLNGLTDNIAEDLAQDCLLILWQKAQYFDAGRGTVGSWLFTIARNRRIDYFRSAGSKGLLPNSTAYPEPIVPSFDREYETISEQRTHRNILDNILSQEFLTMLPNDQSQVLQDIYIEGYSQQDVAKKRGIPLGTVKSRLRLALKKLKKHT